MHFPRCSPQSWALLLLMAMMASICSAMTGRETARVEEHSSARYRAALETLPVRLKEENENTVSYSWDDIKKDIIKDIKARIDATDPNMSPNDKVKETEIDREAVEIIIAAGKMTTSENRRTLEAFSKKFHLQSMLLSPEFNGKNYFYLSEAQKLNLLKDTNFKNFISNEGFLDSLDTNSLWALLSEPKIHEWAEKLGMIPDPRKPPPHKYITKRIEYDGSLATLDGQEVNFAELEKKPNTNVIFTVRHFTSKTNAHFSAYFERNRDGGLGDKDATQAAVMRLERAIKADPNIMGWPMHRGPAQGQLRGLVDQLVALAGRQNLNLKSMFLAAGPSLRTQDTMNSVAVETQALVGPISDTIHLFNGFRELDLNSMSRIPDKPRDDERDISRIVTINNDHLTGENAIPKPEVIPIGRANYGDDVFWHIYSLLLNKAPDKQAREQIRRDVREAMQQDTHAFIEGLKQGQPALVAGHSESLGPILDTLEAPVNEESSQKDIGRNTFNWGKLAIYLVTHD